jgi:hypothetical protein
LSKFSILILFALLLLNSCRNRGLNNSDTALARVYDAYLYASDLQGLVPADATSADSLAICRSYIDNWIKNQLLLYQAEKNLTDEQKDFSRELEDYRTSLIVYKYESELIAQSLDTVVTDGEIEKYYRSNKDNFKLRNDIVQVVFVKVKSNSPYRKRIETLVKSDRQEDRDSLEFYCIRYAEDYEIADEKWIYLNDLLARVPLKIDNPGNYLKQHKYIRQKVDNDDYFVHFLDFRLSGDNSPLVLERSNIKSIILNMRKKLLIRNMTRELFNRAMQNNDFEYY